MAAKEHLYGTTRTANREQDFNHWVGRSLPTYDQVSGERVGPVPTYKRWLTSTPIGADSLPPQPPTRPDTVSGMIQAVRFHQTEHGVSASTAANMVMGQDSDAARLWPTVSGSESSLPMSSGVDGVISHALALAEARKKTSTTEQLYGNAAKQLLVEESKKTQGEPENPVQGKRHENETDRMTFVNEFPEPSPKIRSRQRLEAQFATALYELVADKDMTTLEYVEKLEDIRVLPLAELKGAVGLLDLVLAGDITMADMDEDLAAIRNKRINPEEEVNDELEYVFALADGIARDKEDDKRKLDRKRISVINPSATKLPTTVDGVHRIHEVSAVPNETAEVVLLPEECTDDSDETLVDKFVDLFVFTNPDGGIIGGRRSIRAIEALRRSPLINSEWLQTVPDPEDPKGSTVTVVYVMPQQVRIPKQHEAVEYSSS